jgi:hypothetical protein
MLDGAGRVYVQLDGKTRLVHLFYVMERIEVKNSRTVQTTPSSTGVCDGIFLFRDFTRFAGRRPALS